MHEIPVFAGLGSDSLFSPRTSETALQDATLPETEILLRSCHQIFLAEIAKANDDENFVSGIDLEDFQEPQKLIRSPEHYRRNIVVQHTTLYLIQLLRYIRHMHSKPSSGLLAVAGFCAGLIPAAAIASSTDLITLLSQGQSFFFVIVWLGIRCESYKQNEIARFPCQPGLPWSVVVDGLSPKHAKEILSEQREAGPDSPEVYISAINADKCCTLSGRGDRLQQFIREKLPPQCRARETNVRSLYHSRPKLTKLRDQIFQDLRSRMISCPSSFVFNAPLLSTIDGKPINISDESSLENLCVTLLDMILLEPANWQSVQICIISTIKRAEAYEDSSYNILNFGPGYGMSKSDALPSNVTILDVSSDKFDQPISHSSGSLAGDDVAIVGMGVDLPGAPNPATLWEHLCEGVNSCAEIPRSRFPVENFYQQKDHGGKKKTRSLETKYGNFINSPFHFDNEFFDISQREARSIDPQQRVVLQTAYRALEDAGYVADSTPSYARETFGCFIGNATLDYTDNLRNEIDVYYSPGTLRAFQSGRISYVFGWSGPCMTLDTACSSSLVAIHQASRALAMGDCRAALVGGVNVITSPDMYLGLDRARFLSPTGQCKAFDASADGYCRSEGCAVFVIKKLSDALSEGDRIHGVIKGIEVNQSGNAHSITHPHAPTQGRLFQTLLKKIRVHPHQVSVVELHGTGTQAGDPNELSSIREALCNSRDPRNLLHLTSIKANIGHCEAASGTAALAKMILMIKHGKIPPQISLKNLNPKIRELGSDGAVIDRETALWPRPSGHPRIAMLNNFGAAGSNGALILQEYHADNLSAENDQKGMHHWVLGCSAKSVDALRSLRDALISFLENNSTACSIRDICYTSTARRHIYDYRISATAGSKEELIEQLQNSSPSSIREVSDSRPYAVFAFSGQGSQYMGMGQELMAMHPSFNRTVMDCERLLTSHGYPGCLDVIAPKTKTETQNADTTRSQSFQVGVFVLEVCLARLLISWGVVPAVVVGHSLGEYAALVIAGVISLESGLMLFAHRAQLMMGLCQLNATSMLAVATSADTVRRAVANDDKLQGLAISCNNSSSDCVVGGRIPQLKYLKEQLSSGVKAKSKILDVPLAYHTEAMDPILQELTKYAQAIEMKKPEISIVSNVFGRVVQAGESAFTEDYFALHCRQMVAFDEGIQDLLQNDIDAVSLRWIEIGPNPSLLPMVKSSFGKNPPELLPSLRKGVSPSATISQILGRLYLSTTGMDWRMVFEGHLKPVQVDLPGMPFFEKEFRAEYRESQGEPASQGIEEVSEADIPPHTFLSKIVQRPSTTNNYTSIYETKIDVLKDYIEGHVVCGYALCPASVYHEMALSAVKDHRVDNADDLIWSLSQVHYVSPLLYLENGSNTVVRTSVNKTDQSGSAHHFTVSSNVQGPDADQQNVHCEGLVKTRSRALVGQKYTRLAMALEHKKSLYSSQTSSQEVFFTRAMYEKIFTRVVTYSALYQVVQSIRVNRDTNEAFAVCRLQGPENTDNSGKATIVMDVLLHVAGFVANYDVDNGSACICKEVKSAVLTQELASPSQTFEVHCNMLALPSERSMIADAYAVGSNGIFAVFKGMLFQEVKQAKLNQAFRITAKNSTRSGTASEQAAATQPSPAASRHSSTPQQMTPQSSDSKAPVDIKNIIAKTCGISPASLSDDTSLTALGFDSLMLSELESNIVSEAGPQPNISSLAQCESVGDVERLCHIQEQAVDNEDNGHTTDGSVSRQTPNKGPSVTSIIADTCGADPSSVSANVELETLGIDSLMISELHSRLEEVSSSKKVSSAELSECQTVADVEKMVEMLRSDKTVSSTPPSSANSAESPTDLASSLTATPPTAIGSPISAQNSPFALDKVLGLQTQPERIQSGDHDGSDAYPLFLVHDGSGICLPYRRLTPLHRAVFGIHDPKILTQESWPDIPAMATDYADLIRQTHGKPSILGGWSFGGVVAFEAARILLQIGHGVAGVILIDSPPPVHHQPLSPAVIAAVTSGGQQNAEHAGDRKRRIAVRDLMSRSFASCAKMLAAFTPDSKPAPPRIVLLRSREGFRLPKKEEGGSEEEPENAWLQDREDPGTGVAGWESVVKSKISVVDIPGNHFQPFDAENVHTVSAAISNACLEMQSSYSGTG